MHKGQVKLEITRNIAVDVIEGEEAEEEVEATNGMQMDVGMGGLAGGLDRRGPDWQCSEENEEQTR